MTLRGEASDASRRIVGVYRKSELNDPEVYTAILIALLLEYPHSIVTRVAHPVHGLQSRMKFLPTIAEVREACEQEQKRQRNLVVVARWQLQEHERRERLQAEREAFENEKVDPARVDEILKTYRNREQAG